MACFDGVGEDGGEGNGFLAQGDADFLRIGGDGVVVQG